MQAERTTTVREFPWERSSQPHRSTGTVRRDLHALSEARRSMRQADESDAEADQVSLASLPGPPP